MKRGTPTLLLGLEIYEDSVVVGKNNLPRSRPPARIVSLKWA
jgi:hypothetical protein